jgi:hypothetical protein
MTSGRRRFVLLSAIVVLALASAAILRGSILRAAGGVLVAGDPLMPADVIVLTVDADGAGVLEAADLVRQGVATRVAVFADPPNAVDRELLRRGVPYEDEADRAVRQLRALGVETVEPIPRAVAGTEDEGETLPLWCDQHGFRSIVVVSTSDHSRRVRRVLRRAMKGHETRVVVRPSRYSEFDPDRWWKTRAGARIGIVELEKLLLDVTLHPIS